MFCAANISQFRQLPCDDYVWQRSEREQKGEAMSYVGTFVLRKLRQVREKAGISQQQLANATGLPLPDVVSIEQGRTKVSTTTAAKLANALNISLADLMK